MTHSFISFVRYKFKPRKQELYLSGARELNPKGPLIHHIDQTDNYDYYFICLCKSESALVGLRPLMATSLNQVRALMENLSDDQEETDPISGPLVA